MNMLIKIQTVEEWVKKHDPALCCLQETHFKYNDTGKLKAEGWKKMYGVNINQRKAGAAILIPDKIDFREKILPGKKEESSYKEEIVTLSGRPIKILSVYVPNNKASKHMKQKLI